MGEWTSARQYPLFLDRVTQNEGRELAQTGNSAIISLLLDIHTKDWENRIGLLAVRLQGRLARTPESPQRQMLCDQ